MSKENDGTLSGTIGNQCTYVQPVPTYKVIEETEEYYIVDKGNGSPGVIEKEKARVETITGRVS